LILNLCVIINRLPAETQEQLKKMSSTRLAVKLGKAGFDPNCLEQLERADLLEAQVETMLVEPALESETDLIREAREASQILFYAGDSSSAASNGESAAFRLRELELEKRRTAREAEEGKAVREAEQRQLEAEEWKAAREAEAQRLALGVEQKK